MTTRAEEAAKVARLNAAESMGGGRMGAPTIPAGFVSTIKPVSTRLANVKRRLDVSDIPLEKLVVDDDQPRKFFEDRDEDGEGQDAEGKTPIDRLAESLKTHGQLQPIRVRWDESLGKYKVQVGGRRFRAALRAGLPTLACVIDERELTPDQVLSVQLIENLLREDLLPQETARSYRILMDQHGYTQTRLSEEIGVPQAAIAKALATLDLPEDVQSLIDAGKITPNAAYQVARVDGADAQREIAAKVVAENLTVAQTTELVAKAPKAKQGRAGAAKPKAKPKSAKLPTERKAKSSRTGLRVLVTGRKGFDVAAWIQALEDALVEARAVAKGQGGDVETDAA